MGIFQSVLGWMGAMAQAVNPGVGRVAWAGFIVFMGLLVGWLGGKLLGMLFRVIFLLVGVVVAWEVVHGA